MTLVHSLMVLIFPGIMIYAAMMDMFTMTIPNRVVLALIGFFIAFVPFSGMDLQQFGMHIFAGILMLLITFLMYTFVGGIGGGDAKFFAATGLWIGFNESLFMYALYASLFGGALTIFLLLMNKIPAPAFLVKQPWFVRIYDLKSGVPYGIALAAAGVLVFPDTIWMKVAGI